MTITFRSTFSFIIFFCSLTQYTAQAQVAAFSYDFQSGAKYTYDVVQKTSVSETTHDPRTKKLIQIDTTTELRVTKTWEVKSVTESNATMEMSISAMRQEVQQKAGDAEIAKSLLDSSRPEDAKAMSFLNKPILTVKINARGEVLESKSENPDAEARLQVELPFRVILPKDPLKPELKWEREFKMKLPPPLGTGELLDTIQKCEYRGEKEGYAVVSYTTALKEKLEDPALRPAVIPSLWNGDVFVNLKSRQYQGANLQVQETVTNHQGPDTKFSYSSKYTEVLRMK